MTLSDSSDEGVTPAASSSFCARLREALADRSAESVGEAIEVAASTVRNWRSGKSEPGLSNLVALSDVLGVRLEWLATGEQPMRPGKVQESSGGALQRHSVEEMGDDYILLPRYDVRAAAGAGAVIHSEQIVDYLSFKAEWIRHRLRRNPQYLLLIEAMGDSMEPLIADGDLLLLDTQIDHVRDNAIYAINVCGSLMVKRVMRRLDGGLIIASDNDRYPPEIIAANDTDRVHVVGQVVWHAGVL